jgi:hypothetical protein
MKRLLMVLCIVLAGVVFSANFCYAICAIPPHIGAPYITVIKYVPNKTKVQETWECVEDIEYFLGNGICFWNRLDDQGNSQAICITGEYRIVYPPNMSP